MQGSSESKSNFFERLPVIAILCLLIFIIFARTGESMHGQLTQLGAYVWDDYFVLRSEINDPSCDPNIIVQQRLDELEAQATGSSDDFDLFDEGFDRDAARTSLENQVRQCIQEHALVDQLKAKVTPSLELFSSVEHKFSEISVMAL